jgi:tetratricopeptide (TPR) repeat protein/tRNA A-37 threonylcarbamoyl transferase component Bud32
MTDQIDRLKSALSDRYAIERELGRGGMAVVYLAQDLKHEREVALKVLRPELAATVGADRFLREIRIAAKLSHPHILPLHDSGEVDGFLFYVMPFVEGQSLRDRLTRERELPISEAVRILRDVVDALSLAHSHEVIHRDIKPDNVMLSGRHALVTDFGVAKALSQAKSTSDLTTAGVALGTPAYMSPEQAVADEQVDHRSDIYAVGALAYELLTGRPPFLGTTPQMVLSAHVADPPDPVTKYRENVSPPLEHLVMRCLEKKPADRWQSADELLAQLEAVVTPSGGMTPTTTRPITRMSAQKRKRVFWGGAATLTAVVAAAAVFLLPSWAEHEPELTPERVVVIPLENRTGDSTLDDLGVMAADWIGQAIQQVEAVEVVPVTYARQYFEDASGEGSSDVVRAVANRTNAGLVVSGTFYNVGDSLQFRVEIIDMNSGRPLQSVDGVWPRDSRREAINSLGQRVGGALAYEFDPLTPQEMQPLTSPPPLEAYREFVLGQQLYDRGEAEEALEHWITAHDLDTAFIEPLVSAGMVAHGLGYNEMGDSLYQYVSRRRHRMPRGAQITLDMLLAYRDGDLQAQLRAARELHILDPHALTGAFAHGATAISLNLPQEALDALADWDPYAQWNRNWPQGWIRLTEAYHMLSDHEQELVEARRARDMHPTRLGVLTLEVQALAALGRVEEVRELLYQARTLVRDPSRAAIVAGLELRAHGYPEAAREAFESAVEWLQALPAEEAEDPGFRRRLADALYHAARWEEAQELYQGLAAESNDNIGALGSVGRIAARMGDTATALEVSEQIAEMSRPDRLDDRLVIRASIAALLDQPDQAMRLLREAFFEGFSYGIGLHRDTDLESLRDREDYKELMRPKG